MALPDICPESQHNNLENTFDPSFPLHSSCDSSLSTIIVPKSFSYPYVCVYFFSIVWLRDHLSSGSLQLLDSPFFSQEKEKKTQITKIRNRISTLLSTLQILIEWKKNPLKKIDANILDSLDKIENFLERHNLSKMSQEKIENLNWLISNKGTELGWKKPFHK